MGGRDGRGGSGDFDGAVNEVPFSGTLRGGRCFGVGEGEVHVDNVRGLLFGGSYLIRDVSCDEWRWV